MSQTLCRLDELERMSCREFTLQLGDNETAAAFLLRLDDNRVVAYQNNCPHTGAPLNWNPHEFLSYDKAFIQCAIHGALFRLEDGLCLHGPCNGRSLLPVGITINAGVISTKHK